MNARPAVAPSQPESTTPTDKQICLYIAEICAELRHMAKRPQFRTINYLLDMARLESEKSAKSMPD